MTYFDAYSPAWGILGGFGLFLFGIRYLSETLQRVSGPKFKRLLDSAVQNRLTGLLFGGALTSLLKSETMAAIIVVTFMNSGLFSLYQALPVFLGTTMGTAVAVHLVGVLATPFTFSLILCGVAAKYFSRRRRMVAIGELCIGVGLIFLGLGIVEEGFSYVTARTTTPGILAVLDGSRITACAFGALITVLLQSGRAALAVIVTLAASRAISSEAAFSMLAGELLGAPLMAILASMLGTPVARIASCVFLFFNGVAAISLLIFVPEIMRLSAGLSSRLPDQLAIVHLFASAACAAVFLPLVGILLRRISSFDHIRTALTDITPRPRFIDDRILSTPGIAFSQLREEVMRMASVCRSMSMDFDSLLYRYDSKIVTRITQQEEVMDLLQRDITEFLTKLSPVIVDLQDRYDLTRLLTTVNYLEQAGDSISDMMRALGRKKDQRVQFSHQAMNDLKMLSASLCEFFDLILREWSDPAAFPVSAASDHRRSIHELAVDAMESHLERLAEGKCSVRGALIYNDLLEAGERLASSIGKIYDNHLMGNP